MTQDRIIMEYKPSHDCFSCKFRNKCPRQIEIYDALRNMEINAVGKWGMDLKMTYHISECNLYRMDFSVINQVATQQQQYMQEDEGDDDDEDEELDKIP